MDNLSWHKVQGVRERIEAAGAQLLYLPPYSPDLNPIEKAWAKLKQLLRTAKARTKEALDQAIAELLPLLTAEDARAWFRLPFPLYNNRRNSLVSVRRRLCTRAVVAEEDRQIVVLRIGPLLDCSDDPVRGGGWSKLSRLPQHDGQSVLPEEISLGVGGLDEAVGVEQEAITGFQKMDRVGDCGKVEGPEDQTVLDDFEHSSAAQQKHELMPRRRISQFPRTRVEVKVGRGYELALRVAAKKGVHSWQKSGGIGSVRALSRNRYFHYGGDERGSDTVAGDVSDKKSGLRVVGHNEVVEISG